MFERSGLLIQRKFREYLLPTLFMTMSVSLSNVVGSVLVGNLLGEKALSAISLAGPVVYLINAVFFLFAVGGMTLAAVAKGRRDDAAANGYFTMTFVAGLALMCLFAVLLAAFAGPIAGKLARGDAVLGPLCAAYLAPVSLVGPLCLGALGMAMFVRADGRPGAAARIALIANGVNLLLAYLLIRYAGIGIAGAGWAMVGGYGVGLLTLWPYLRSRERSFHFAWPAAPVRMTGTITWYGLPKALAQMCSLARTLALNFLILGLSGAAGIAALAVCLNALLLTNMFIGGANDTLLPIVGTLFGEKDYPGIRFALRSALRMLLFACLGMMALFVFFPGEVARVFGITTPEGLATVKTALRLYALSLPLYGVNFMLQNYLQTAGRVRFASLIALLDGFVLVVGFAFLLSRLGADWVWLAFILAECGTLLVILVNCRRLAAKEKSDPWLLLPPDQEAGAKLDLSIPATEAAAVGLSAQVIQFCRGEGVDAAAANRVGLAVEEMAVNTARHGQKGRGNAKPAAIDLLVRVNPDTILLRLRDDGAPFDPSTYKPEEKPDYAIGGIDVIRRLMLHLSYSRQLGFNTVIISLARK